MATYILTDGTSYPPRREDYITQKTACRMAGVGTPHPVWDAFLLRVTAGDDELIKFLQRFIGYCLTGHTREHVFLFVFGTGRNGKGTFINTILKILGDYATVASISTFLASKGDRHPTELAKLRGKRLVVAQETPAGRVWDEAKIKAVTGGDRISAHFMRQDDFEFDPKFKLIISGNHLRAASCAVQLWSWQCPRCWGSTRLAIFDCCSSLREPRGRGGEPNARGARKSVCKR